MLERAEGGLFPSYWYQIAKFGTVGAITFGINFLVFAFCYGRLNLDYRIAASIAYAVTALCHFGLNRHFTFGAGSQTLTRNVPRYGAMLVLNYLITLTASWVTVDVLGLSAYFAVVTSTLGTAASSFLVMKYFVFRRLPV